MAQPAPQQYPSRIRGQAAEDVKQAATDDQACPVTATDGPYRGETGAALYWGGFGLCAATVAVLVGIFQTVPFGVGIMAVVILAQITYVAVLILGAVRHSERQTSLMRHELRAHDRSRSAEYGAVSRRISYVAETATATLAEWGQRIEDMYVASDAAEARRNVERTDQLTALAQTLTQYNQWATESRNSVHTRLDELQTRIDESAETFAGELLAVNGALNGVRASLDAQKPLPAMQPSDIVLAGRTEAE